MTVLKLTLNGQAREFEGLEEGAALETVVAALGLKADRVAVERNGEIVARGRWAETRVAGGDRLEVVHFVGGGLVDWGGESPGGAERLP